MARAFASEVVDLDLIPVTARSGVRTGGREGGFRGSNPPIEDFKRNEKLSLGTKRLFSCRDCQNCSHVFLCYPTCL